MSAFGHKATSAHLVGRTLRRRHCAAIGHWAL